MNAPDTGVRTVLVTAPDAADAERIARALVEERLAACGNLVPAVRSIFRWQGEVRTEEEALLVLKTTAGLADALARRVVELHSYDVPEVLVLAVEGGERAYLDWVRVETEGAA